MKFKTIRRAVSILNNTKHELKNLSHKKFESVLTDYLIMLILLSSLAAIVTVILVVLKAVYLDLLYQIDVQYWRMINYTFGRATSLMFLYLFIGTFGLFLLSLILKPFFWKLKYTSLLKIIFYSLTPLLLFGWIPIFAWALLIWSIFIFYDGIRLSKDTHVKKNSVNSR